MEKTVDMAIVEKNRKQISTLGGILGGKYFTIAAQETYPNFDKVKRENEANNSLDFMPNRSPRRFIVRDHDVLSQAIETSADGTTKVVFNPGSANEAKASLVAGNIGFGVATEEAIKDALTGQNRIFANGSAIAKKINEYNQSELERVNVLIKQLQSQRDAILSTIKANTDKVNKYEQEIIASTPKVLIEKENESPAIIIEPAE